MKIVLATAAVILVVVHGTHTDPTTSTTATSPTSSYGGYCPRVDCPRGFYLDDDKCICIKKSNPKPCPYGLYPVSLEGGFCACRSISDPDCKKGFGLDRRDCRCELKKRPDCPDYSSLKRYGGQDYCIGKHDPVCPKGSWLLDNCSCSIHILRKCEKGYLDPYGCKCIETDDAVCEDHHDYDCRLNKKTCRCERRQRIYCYKRRWCRGDYITVYDPEECCNGGYYSYRQHAGRCYYTDCD